MSCVFNSAGSLLGLIWTAVVSDNEWSKITSGGDVVIQGWINAQFLGKSCAVVLIGSHTAGRKWIKYEIKKAWDDKKGLVGVYIHNLTDASGNKSVKGRNPFEDFSIDGKKLSSIVKAYIPPYESSPNVYDYIKKQLAEWVDEAVTIRANYGKNAAPAGLFGPPWR